MSKTSCRCITLLLRASVPSWAEPGRYPAVVERVADGDALDLVTTLGFEIILRERCRLVDVNVAELGTANARKG